MKFFLFSYIAQTTNLYYYEVVGFSFPI